jgi:hypothetical protein
MANAAYPDERNKAAAELAAKEEAEAAARASAQSH